MYKRAYKNNFIYSFIYDLLLILSKDRVVQNNKPANALPKDKYIQLVIII